MNYYLMLLIFALVSIINSYLDFKTFHISLTLNYSGLILCLLVLLIGKSQELVNHIAGGVCLFLFLILVRYISHKGLGWGDIHYSTLCGFAAGVPGFIVCTFISSIAGIIFFLSLKFLFKRKNAFELRIPFIPMMFIGNLIGIPITNYILSLL